MFINHDLGPKINKAYDPYVISVGVVVILLLLMSLGIGLYSCNWSYFLNHCVTVIFFGIDSNETSVFDNGANFRPNKNKSAVNEDPPSYESLEWVHSIYDPNQIEINEQMHHSFEAPPPDYKNVDLSNSINLNQVQ